MIRSPLTVSPWQSTRARSLAAGVAAAVPVGAGRPPFGADAVQLSHRTSTLSHSSARVPWRSVVTAIAEVLE
ncbi:hypothetical protein CCS38_29715 [Streptomyces purpurogeneiscleroticus]|nr:hypothetical protein [Streptomyces purpurogeneiscleroticus]